MEKKSKANQLMAAGVTAPLLMAASGSNTSPGHTRARPCQAASLAWARRTRQPGGGSPAPAYAELCAGAYLAGPSHVGCAWPRVASVARWSTRPRRRRTVARRPAPEARRTRWERRLTGLRLRWRGRKVRKGSEGR